VIAQVTARQRNSRTACITTTTGRRYDVLTALSADYNEYTDFPSVLVVCHLQKLCIDIARALALRIKDELVIAAIGTCNCNTHAHAEIASKYCKTL